LFKEDKKLEFSTRPHAVIYKNLDPTRPDLRVNQNCGSTLPDPRVDLNISGLASYSLLHLLGHAELDDHHYHIHDSAGVIHVKRFHSCWVIRLQFKKTLKTPQLKQQ